MKALHQALICGTLLVSATQVQASRVSGEVVQGEVLVQAPDGSWQPGLPLLPGSQVRTNTKEAVVSLGHALVKISPNSQFQIKDLSNQEAHLDLSASTGRIYVNVDTGSKVTADFASEQIVSSEGQFVLGYGRSLGLMTFEGNVSATKGVKRVASSDDWEGQGSYIADSDQESGEPEVDDLAKDDEEEDTSDDRGYYILGGVAGAGLIAIIARSSNDQGLYTAPASP